MDKTLNKMTKKELLAEYMLSNDTKYQEEIRIVLAYKHGYKFDG